VSGSNTNAWPTLLPADLDQAATVLSRYSARLRRPESRRILRISTLCNIWRHNNNVKSIPCHGVPACQSCLLRGCVVHKRINGSRSCTGEDFWSWWFKVHYNMVEFSIALHGEVAKYDTRCYFNVRSKAYMSQLNLPQLNSLKQKKTKK